MGTFLKRSNTAKLHYSEDELLSLFTEAENTSEDKGVSLSVDKIEKLIAAFASKLNSLDASQLSALQSNPQKMATFLSGLFENVSSSKIKQIIGDGQKAESSSSSWKGGVWKGGYWEKGTWPYGTWQRGTWKKGTWKDGIWEAGTWKRGVWRNGTWRRGIWENGFWKDGVWEDGFWVNGTWENGIWRDGTWRNGIWKKGTWEGGSWKTGLIYDPDRKGNFEKNWKWRDGYVRSPINPAEYFKKK